jgi:hypothetical protein
MDPEIQRALQLGYSPQEIAAELRARGAPVPPELEEMARPTLGDALRSVSEPAAAAAAVGTGVALGGRAGNRAARAIRPKYRAARRLDSAIEREGGVQRLIQQLQEFNRTGRTDVVLSDLGPHLASEADFAANANDELRTNLQDIHAERRRAAPQRLIQDVEQVAPGGYSDAQATQARLQAEQAEFAGGPQGFQGLRDRNPVIAPEGAGRLGAFLQSPKLAKVWQDASAVGAVGPLPPAEALSFEVLQNLKERLDGLTDAAWRKGDGDLGRRLGAARDELVSTLAESVPNYAEVSAKYAEFSKARSAVEAGLETWRSRDMQLPELQRVITSYSAPERELFRQGVLAAYLRDVENAQTNRNFARQMLDESPVQQKKLELIFGGESGFKEALVRFRQENSMARLAEIVGGSQTHRRGMATSLDAVDGLTDAAVAGPLGAARAAGRQVPGMIAKREARHLAPVFRTRGSSALEQLLRALR